MVKITAALAVAAGSLASVQALSASCTGQIAGLAFGNLGQCLQITSLIPVVTGGASGSLVDPINSYLNNFCASSTPTCSNDTLQSANQTIVSGCSSDLQAGGADAQQVQALQSVLGFYPQFKAAGCAKNQTLNQFCLTSTLQQAQNISGTNLDSNFLSLLLGSGGGAQTQALGQAFQSGQLCTGCVQTLYNQAVAANASVSTSGVGSAISSACPNFASQSASGVSSAAFSAAATSNAATSSAAAASSSRSAGMATSSFSFSSGVIMSTVAMIGAVAAGGALVL